MRSVLANNSTTRDSPLIQVKLHNEYCEELGTRLNLSTLNLDLNFRETISHADDLRYAGIKVKDLERHVLEHEWREKHATIHYGYSIGLYVIIGLLSFYIVFHLIRCMRSRGTCQIVVGALKRISPIEANPESVGSGNVININIKTSNESLANSSENIPLRALKPSDSRTGESETRPTHRCHPSRWFLISTNFRCKFGPFPGGGVACLPAKIPQGHLLAPVLLGSLLYLPFAPHSNSAL